jgi:hypothetical protein
MSSRQPYRGKIRSSWTYKGAKDLQDIEGLLAAHPEADVVAVRQSVREFATAMSMSDMLDDFDKVVARSKSRR